MRQPMSVNRFKKLVKVSLLSDSDTKITKFAVLLHWIASERTQRHVYFWRFLGTRGMGGFCVFVCDVLLLHTSVCSV